MDKVEINSITAVITNKRGEVQALGYERGFYETNQALLDNLETDLSDYFGEKLETKDVRSIMTNVDFKGNKAPQINVYEGGKYEDVQGLVEAILTPLESLLVSEDGSK